MAGNNKSNTTKTEPSGIEYDASANRYNGQLNNKPRKTCFITNTAVATTRLYRCFREL